MIVCYICQKKINCRCQNNDIKQSGKRIKCFMSKIYPKSLYIDTVNDPILIHLCSNECEMRYKTNKLPMIPSSIDQREFEHLPNQQQLVIGQQITQSSQDSLQRARELVNNTMDTAAKTAVVLNEQTNEMKHISIELDNVDSEVKQGQKILRQFMKKIMTDKCLLCGLCLLIILLVGVIVIAIYFGVIHT